MSRGLLSRLGAERTLTSRARDEDPSRAIAEHLQVLLNARQGSSPAVPEHGLIDFADIVHGFPASLQKLLGAIRSTVLEYEPRLKNVSVRHLADEDPLTLKFEISGQLQDGRTGPGTLRFRTQIAAGGRVDVK